METTGPAKEVKYRGEDRVRGLSECWVFLVFPVAYSFAYCFACHLHTIR